MPDKDERKEERQKVNVVVNVKEGYETYQAICGDLSGGGCRLRTNHLIPNKTVISFEIYGKTAQGTLKIYEAIDGIVRWSKPTKDPSVFFAGIEFTHKITVAHGVLQSLFPEKFKNE